MHMGVFTLAFVATELKRSRSHYPVTESSNTTYRSCVGSSTRARASPPVRHHLSHCSKGSKGSTNEAAKVTAHIVASMRAQRRSQWQARRVCIVLTQATHDTLFLVATRVKQHHSVDITLVWLRFACAAQHASDGNVRSQLRSSETHKILRQHFDASTIGCSDPDVHVAEKRVEPKHGALDWCCTLAASPCAWACGSDIARPATYVCVGCLSCNSLSVSLVSCFLLVFVPPSLSQHAQVTIYTPNSIYLGHVHRFVVVPTVWLTAVHAETNLPTCTCISYKFKAIFKCSFAHIWKLSFSCVHTDIC